MIPVISAIGNHDIVGQFNQTPVQAAVFTTLFPMPGPTVYNVLDFENFLSLFILDSGHANRIGGKQTEWLQEALAQRQSQKHKFAIYHVPAYPSVRSFNTRRGSALRRYWVPLFEKYHVDAVFEHHDHAYKRTHPLIKNKIHSQGVVYLGDGAWGIEKPRTTKKKKHPPYIAKFASKRHFVLVDLSQNKQLFKSITDEGIVIDEYTRILSTFKQESESDNLTKL